MKLAWTCALVGALGLAQAQTFGQLCDTCFGLVGGYVATSCGSAVSLVVAGDATCADVRESNCSCCGFCDASDEALRTQYQAYHVCPTPDGKTPCNFCQGSTYSERDVVVEGCRAPVNADRTIALSFFFGMYGAPYFIYGYTTLGIVMSVIAGVGLIFIFIGRARSPVLLAIGGVLKGGMACWGFVAFIMVAVYHLMPVANQYDIYCPIQCRSDGYAPTISEDGTNFAPTSAQASP